MSNAIIQAEVLDAIEDYTSEMFDMVLDDVQFVGNNKYVARMLDTKTTITYTVIDGDIVNFYIKG